MSWYLSKHYLLVLFFFPIHAAVTIHHRLWSQLSKCLLNVTQVFTQGCQSVLCSCVCGMWCVGVRVKCTRICAESTTVICVHVGACVYTSEHKPYPERDKSNPLPGGAQGSSIDGTLSGCWWTSLSDKVYHSDLSQSKTLSGISKHQWNWRPKFFTWGKLSRQCPHYWKYVHNAFVLLNDFSRTSNLNSRR